jgi:hypothetical protein
MLYEISRKKKGDNKTQYSLTITQHYNTLKV